MAKIKPFKGIVYNQEKIKDIAKAVCPPYDVISVSRQQYFNELDPYNFIRILLGKDIAGEDKYQRAKEHFNDWLKDEIFIQDNKPAIYFYSQHFVVLGEKKTRLGFIALLRLADKDSAVFGHEHTRLEPKEDRFKLLKATKANLSPIFVIFSDKKRIILYLWHKYIQNSPPFIDIIDDDKVQHKLWRITSEDILNSIQEKLAGENIFIADGHHRYEVACAFRDLMLKKISNPTGEEGFNYILAYFTNPDPRGLVIFATHRLVKLKYKLDMDNFKAGLAQYFDVEPVKEKTKLFFMMEKGGFSEHVLGMYYDKKYWLLRLKNIKILDKLITDRNKEYRSLDVSILNYIILKKILGLDLEDKEKLEFNNQAQELIEYADDHATAIVFFLNPVKIQKVMSVALSGEKMPPKSTYFYPKVLSGLVINKLNI
jgi:uncharacterized protein (DUF1015 family)